MVPVVVVMVVVVEVVHHFVPFFSLLENHKVEGPAAAPLLIKLAGMKLDSNDSLSCGGTSLEVRTRFFSSSLWKGYLTKRRERRFQLASEAEDEERRLALLKSLASDPELPETLQTSVSTALSLFDPDIPELERLKFAVAQQWRMKMAHDWAPSSAVGGLHPLFSKDLVLDKSYQTYHAFHSSCKLLMMGGGLESAPGLHPIVKATVALLAAIDAIKDESEQPGAWKAMIAQSSIAHRCGVQDWAPTLEPCAVDVPTACTSRVLKVVEKFFGRQEKRPCWVGGLRERSKVPVAPVTPVDSVGVINLVAQEGNAAIANTTQLGTAIATESASCGQPAAAEPSAAGAQGWWQL